jgi:pyruvate dehydrogenase E2 component (dihydrolipoamide acetyltransferase)
MKAAVAALKTHPRFNASLDEQNQEIVLKKYFHLGIATATERGLVVPVVRDVDQKSLLSLAKEVSELTERTRAMKADLSELKGSSFTITSLGALGGLFATPIINYPETSIMGIYQIKPTPVVKNDKVVIQEVMYFSLSLDHRVIDGHEAASFGNEFKKHLEDPSILFSKLT